ncbi:MAG: hypothetical protein HC859_13405 [Bacteroidia bacterium]|nr:hypothetical protein [Bacteroidia bacterium]
MKRILLLIFTCWLVACDEEQLSTAPPEGKAGSLARFAMVDNYLYVVNNSSIRIFKMDDAGAIHEEAAREVGIGIETIVARGNHLFLGASDAMYIYDISDRIAPQLLSRYSHLIGCDPVVVQDIYAYVTIRIGSCREAGNDVLEVIDISDVTNPLLLKTYDMNSPHGLGIDGDLLFVCEGDFGLRVMNVSNPLEAATVKQYHDIHAYDVITNNGVLILTGDDGIFQYDYSDPLAITQLSHLGIAL